MIPAAAYANALRIGFGLLAARRGPHWALTTQQLGTEQLDEAELLAEAIAGVMKHVPLPDKEMGLIGDLGTLGMALYLTVGSRLDLDREIKAGRVTLTAGPTAPPGPPPAAREGETIPVPPRQEPPTAARPGDASTIMEGLGDVPLVARAQGHVAGEVPVNPGPRDPLAFDTDPERALFARTQPEGSESATVDELVEAYGSDADGPLLDRLAGEPEFIVG